MGDKSQDQFEDDDLDTLDEFDDDADLDATLEDPVALAKSDALKEQKRLAARREIERRAELKALNSEFEDWDDPLDEADL